MRNELLKAHQWRFACKSFDANRKITAPDFDYILETGRLSPSSFGFEPWQFIVVQNQDIREGIKSFAWGASRQLDTSSHFVIIAIKNPDDLKSDSAYIQSMARDIQKLPNDIVEMKLKFFKKFQEEDFDLNDSRTLKDWAGKQAYIPLANMMTAAAAIGIDSCPIEGFDLEKTNQWLISKGILLPEDYSLALMVAFGYRDESQRISEKTRRPMEDVVKWV